MVFIIILIDTRYCLLPCFFALHILRSQVPRRPPIAVFCHPLSSKLCNFLLFPPAPDKMKDEKGKGKCLCECVCNQFWVSNPLPYVILLHTGLKNLRFESLYLPSNSSTSADRPFLLVVDVENFFKTRIDILRLVNILVNRKFIIFI